MSSRFFLQLICGKFYAGKLRKTEKGPAGAYLSRATFIEDDESKD